MCSFSVFYICLVCVVCSSLNFILQNSTAVTPESAQKSSDSIWAYKQELQLGLWRSPAVVGCHRGCLLPPAVVHVMSHTL